MWKKIAACAVLAVPFVCQAAQLESTRTIEFTTDEGTRLSLDVSPDGKTLVFDLLGDLYTIPISGGKATRLTAGMAYDMTPRFSPDGAHVAFVSDRSGTYNLWVVDTRGGSVRQVSREAHMAGMISPAWLPDGSALVAAVVPEGDGETQLWRFGLSGGQGKRLGLTGLSGGVAFSPDGQRLYATVQAPAATMAAWGSQIVMMDLPTERTQTLNIDKPGGAWRPLISPDGRWLAYVVVDESSKIFVLPRTWNTTAIRLRHLDPGGIPGAHEVASVPDAAGLNGPIDLRLRSADAFPGYAFTPDSRALITWSRGKIKRTEIATGVSREIPFLVDVKAQLAPLVQHKVKLADDAAQARGISAVTQSRDARRIAFAALGKVWSAELADGVARRLMATAFATPSGEVAREFDPAFSPDGARIVFATWSDRVGGRLWKVPAAGGVPLALTGPNSRQAYVLPRWSPDGAKVLFFVAAADRWLAGEDPKASRFEARIGSIGAMGGQETIALMPPIAADASWRPTRALTVSADGERVFFMEHSASEEKSWLRSLPLKTLAGSGLKTHATFSYSFRDGRGIPSPDQRWMIRTASCCGFAFDLLPFDAGTPLTIPQDYPKGIPVGAASALEPQWSPDGVWLMWNAANHFYRVRVSDVIAKRGDVKPEHYPIAVPMPPRFPERALLLRGARVITMAAAGMRRNRAGGDMIATTDPGVIERADVLLSGRRIVRVGRQGSFPVPPAARVMDVSGKTLIPGLIEMHAHPHDVTMIPDLLPALSADLAYGVTTVRQPGDVDIGQLSRAELIETGQLVGARLFGSIALSQSATGPFTLDRQPPPAWQVWAHEMQGANVIKMREWTHRVNQQHFVMAANRARLNIATHAQYGGVFDGVTTLEHRGVPFSDQAPYRDWIQLLARSGTTAVYGNFLDTYQRDRLIANRQRHFPRGYLFKPRSLDEEEPPELRASQRLDFEAYRDILRAGGNLAFGHDKSGGEWTHILMGSFVELGGATPAEALRCVTLNAARALGVADDLGSIEAGKIADLVILHSNPLEDIRRTTDVAYVVKDGWIYEGETLAVSNPSGFPEA